AVSAAVVVNSNIRSPVRLPSRTVRVLKKPVFELTTTAAETALCRGDQAQATAIAAAFSEAVAEASAALGVVVTTLYWTQHRAVRGERTRMISHLLDGAPTLREELHLPDGHTLTFAIHPRAFFQPNTLQAEVIYGMVVDAADLRGQPATRVLDLYCGTGTIGLALSPYATEVVGIELQPNAVENARQNAVHNAVENIVFHCGDVGKVLEAEGLGAPDDRVVVDPPRAGLNPQALELIGQMGIARLVYVSCNPRSLARDVAALRAYGLKAISVQPVDQFPHTMHVESVAVLERV
ncbi:MAG: methyltransferase domain-containing protein, partial [Myxococcota bacterium]